MDAIKFLSVINQHPTLRMNYITVPADVVKAFGGIGTRLTCSVNGHEPYQCGMTALRDGEAYISINKKRMKLYDIQTGDEAEISLNLDDSKYGFDVPEELQALLEQDEMGFRLFEELTGGQQRYIIYYVSLVKSSQLKIDRAIFLINNLKTMPKDSFSFRHLLGLPPKEE